MISTESDASNIYKYRRWLCARAYIVLFSGYSLLFYILLQRDNFDPIIIDRLTHLMPIDVQIEKWKTASPQCVNQVPILLILTYITTFMGVVIGVIYFPKLLCAYNAVQEAIKPGLFPLLVFVFFCCSLLLFVSYYPHNFEYSPYEVYKTGVGVISAASGVSLSGCYIMWLIVVKKD